MKSRSRAFLWAALISGTFSLSFGVPSTQWDGSTNQNWNTGSNWSDGVPDATTDAEIGSAGNGTISLGSGNRFARTLTLLGTADEDWDLNGTGTLNIEGFAVTNESSFTLNINAPLQLAANAALASDQIFADGGDINITNEFNLGSGVNPTINTNSGRTVTLDGEVSGSSSITKTGAGDLVLSGNDDNTFSGGLTVNAGTVTLDKSAGTDAIASDIILNGGTLVLGADNQIADSSGLTLAGGTLQMNGFSDTLGTLTLSGDSVIDFAGGDSVLTFSDFNYVSGSLEIWNWDGEFADGGGNDQILFDSPFSSNLNQIRFYRDDGSDLIEWPTGFTGNELLPIPETSTFLQGMIILVAAAALHLHRKKQKQS